MRHFRSAHGEHLRAVAMEASPRVPHPLKATGVVVARVPAAWRYAKSGGSGASADSDPSPTGRRRTRPRRWR